MVLQGRTRSACVILMAGAIMLSGCQNMSDTQTTQLQGAGGGALIGGVLGLVLGGAKGAAIGAAAGGALGLGVGSVVAERKRQYANAESFYDAQIQATRSRNRQLAQYNDGLARQIAEYRRDIASLRTQISAGSASNQVAIRTNERLQASYAQAKKMLADERHELDVQQRVAEEMRQSKGEQDARTQQEKQQVAALSDHINALQDQVDTLASQSSQLQQFK